MTTFPLCPQCQSQQHAVDIEFCFRCRFPMMLIAGKYRLERLLAEGGQGAVYLAHHTELDLDPLRVIKVVKSELFEQVPNLGARFRREVQVTSALSQRCQHIVRIYDDFGEIPALGRFYVMEHLEGNPLSDLLKDPLNLPDLKVCLHIFHQLCDAMRFAHREDIIHRDLKPDNLMLIAFEDEPLYLKVLDFGIARPTGETDAAMPKLTQGVVGTPQYMAPEQLTGRPVDTRADLYAMGVILYEMLTGQTPHIVQGAGQEAFFELVMSRLQDDPKPPSVVRPDLDIHPAMDEVVMTLLRRNADDRYPRVEVLKEALRDAAREVRRDAKTVLQDTKPEFDDELGDAALHFDLASVTSDPSTRPPTIGYDGSSNEDQGDTPHEAPPLEMVLAAPNLGLQELAIPVIPEASQDDSKVNISDSFEEEATRVAALSSFAPLHAHEADEAEMPVLPLLSDDDYDDATAIDMSPDAQLWLQSTAALQAQAQAPMPDDPTKESPSFHRPIGAPPANHRAKIFGIWIGAFLTICVVLGWWWTKRHPQIPSPQGRVVGTKADKGKIWRTPTREVSAKRPSVPRAFVPMPLPPPTRRPITRRLATRRPRARYTPPQRRRYVRRRHVVKRPTPPTQAALCPTSTTSLHWLHIKMSPPGARLTHLFGGTQLSRAPAKGQRCMGLHGKVKIKLSAKGYDSCILLLSKRTKRRLQIRLKRRRTDGLQIGGGDYCKGTW